jgi:hypothetical protein
MAQGRSGGERCIFKIEVVCSDTDEHRRRVETRTIDVAGLTRPTWQQVIDRQYEPWDRPRLVVDTANRTPAETLEELRSRLDIKRHGLCRRDIRFVGRDH